MQNRYFTIGIALGLLQAGGLGRAEARQHHFISHFASSAVDGVIDANGDGVTAGVFTGIANTTLGRFLVQAEAESLSPLAINKTCPAGTLELPVLQTHAVLTKKSTGEHLFMTYTSGTACVDPTTLTITAHVQGTFSGGTGRFVNAQGPFEEDGTVTILVLDSHGHFFISTTGTLTGAGDGGD